MIETAMRAHWPNPKFAEQQFKGVLLPWCQEMWKRGMPLDIEVRLHEDAKTDGQRRYYHGVVLKEIAQQARIDGKAFPLSVWKEHFRNEYLGFKTVTHINPITGKKSRRRERQSTEGLGVRGYAKLIERVTAFAVVELDVRFSAGSYEEWQRNPIDPDTGEVMSA